MKRVVLALLGTALLAPSAVAVASPGFLANGQSDHVQQAGSRFVVGGEGLDGPDLDKWPDNEGPGESEVSAEVAEQSAVLTAVDELETGLAQLGFGDEGLVGVDWNAEAIDLYWEGALPAPVAAFLESFASDVPVRVHDSTFSREDLHEASLRLLDAVAEGGALSDVAGVAIQEDLSGLRVFTTREDADEVALAAAIQAVLPAVPLEFVFEPWAAENKPAVAGSRLDDRPPFIGGARIEKHTLFGTIQTGSCTSAFSVRNDTNVRGMLTAKHCGENEDWETPTGQYVGNSNGNVTRSDITGLMWTTTTPGFPGFSGRVYNGSYTSSSMQGITGSGYPVIDELQCMSGSYSGTVCNNRVFQRNYYDDDLNGGPMHVTRHTGGDAAAGNGDSGGANYLLDGSASSRRARGVITAISIAEQDVRSCRGVPSDPPNRTCSRVVLSTSVQNYLAATGLRVMTAAY